MMKKKLKKKKSNGKILRVKHGYNPNSSSMGSIVFVLPVFLLVVTVVFGVLSSLVSALALRRRPGDAGPMAGRVYHWFQGMFLKQKIKENLK